jgi:predicted amidophosphoribosyltransferase
MSILSRLFPNECAGCGGPGGPGCPGCLVTLWQPAAPSRPRPAPVDLPPTWTVAAYADPCRALLIAYKERSAVSLRPLLAAALASAVVGAWRGTAGGFGAVPSRVYLVPVPSSPRSVRVRGDDVVRSLARRTAAVLRSEGIDLRVVPALRHVRRVADSAGLSAAARAANLAGAFTVPRRFESVVSGAPVIIVDDVITTGSSLAEAARTLRACGADVIAAAAVAATQRRT